MTTNIKGLLIAGSVFALLVIVFGGFFISYASLRKNPPVGYDPQNYQMTEPPLKPINGGLPEIGMSFSDFDKICTGGKRNWRSYESAQRKTFVFEIPFSDRGDNDCYGTFNFNNEKLSSIAK
jgi:hypothetical protein